MTRIYNYFGRRLPIKKYITVITVVLIAVIVVFPVRAEGPKELYERANSNYWDDNNQQAVKLFKQFIEQYPEHELIQDAKFGLAQAYYEADRLDEATRLFEEVESEHPVTGVRGDALYGQIQAALLEDEPVRARKLMSKFQDKFSGHSLAPAVKNQLEDLQPPGEKENSSSGSAGGITPPPVFSGETQAQAPAADKPGASDGEDTSSADDLDNNLPELRFAVTSESNEEAETSPESSPEVSPGELKEKERKINSLQSKIELQADTIEKLHTENRGLSREIKDMENIITDQQDKIDQLKTEKEKSTEENKILRQRIEEDISFILTGVDTPPMNNGFTLEEIEGELTRSAAYHRELTRQALEVGNYQVAQKNIEKVLEKEPEPGDYYLAARVKWEAEKDSEEALELLAEAPAVEESSVDRLLLEMELLLDQEKFDRLSEIEAKYSERINRKGKKEDIAHWNYLQGRRYLKQNKHDQAFFELMKVIRRAPASSWAEEARQLINDEL
ncbi:MAG: tetratricopeptide repeat protein [bacterium]